MAGNFPCLLLAAAICWRGREYAIAGIDERETTINIALLNFPSE
jgi:hypothetical protein